MRNALLGALAALLLPMGGLSAQGDHGHDDRHHGHHDRAEHAAHAVSLDDGPEPDAVAVLMDARGDSAGVVELVETPRNGVLLRIHARGIPAGAHGFHIHETGRCEPPSFQSAGGHYAPFDRSHGMLHAGGMHGGDLVNLVAGHHGVELAERLARDVSLREGAEGTLFDADGSAIVVHAGADDYRSQPSGDAGDRLLCGVVRR